MRLLAALYFTMQQVRSYKMEKYTYEIVQIGLTQIVLRSDGACIPMVAGNADYEEYLNPQAKQSTPILPGDAN